MRAIIASAAATSAGPRSMKPRGSCGRTSSDKTGPDVDGQREHDRVEEEGDDAMRERGAAHAERDRIDVGRRAGAADHEGVVEEVPEGRRLVARELQPRAGGRRGRRLAIVVRVILMRVMQREEEMDERPGADDR